jgi:hypothetical protein
VLAYHNSLAHALIELFPDIRFKKENFRGKRKFYKLFLFIYFNYNINIRMGTNKIGKLVLAAIKSNWYFLLTAVYLMQLAGLTNRL